ncbi:MAG: PKD domain-containing protein [Nanoarchaeota archaeon]
MDTKAAKYLFTFLVLIIVIPSAIAAVMTLRAQETDMVTVAPEAIDPDNDSIIYTYSRPLNEKGEWKTGYDDEGEYLITITASDEVNESTTEVLLVIENKNQPPYLTEKKIKVKELQTIDLKQFINDPDGDPLEYSFSELFDGGGIWKPGYNSQGSFITSFIVNDGEFAVPLRLEVDIINTNQPPAIVKTFSDAKLVPAQENQKFFFYADAEDGDGDKVTYLWTLDDKVVGDATRGEFFFDFDSAGKHILALVATDGQKGVQEEWTIVVEDVNRRPELNFLPVIVNEGETVRLVLPKKDADGEVLQYSFEEKFDEQGVWVTDFEDAGSYSIYVYASDGKETVKEKVKVKVMDVDRMPELNLPEKLEAREGQKSSWAIDAYDLDGDKVTVSFENAPEGSVFDQKTKNLSWTPDYDYISRRYGLLSNILNTLRLEHRLLQVKKINIKVNACSRERCISAGLPLYIYNNNQPPVLEVPFNITITETELAELKTSVTDPDGDIVRFSFSEPFDGKGRWKTDYDDEGEHIAYVNVNDGISSRTLPVRIIVLGKNRRPTVKVPDEEFAIEEGKELRFSVASFDPDNDTLSVKAEDLPEWASFVNNTFIWTPGYDFVRGKNRSGSLLDMLSGITNLEKGTDSAESELWITFVAYDAEFEVRHPVKITVKDVNQGPVMQEVYPIEKLIINKNQQVMFKAVAADDDGDTLTYSWHFGVGEEEVTETGVIKRTFVNPGEKKVRVTVSDGAVEVEKEWIVTVSEEDLSDVSALALEEPRFKVYVIEH